MGMGSVCVMHRVGGSGGLVHRGGSCGGTDRRGHFYFMSASACCVRRGRWPALAWAAGRGAAAAAVEGTTSKLYRLAMATSFPLCTTRRSPLQQAVTACRAATEKRLGVWVHSSHGRPVLWASTTGGGHRTVARPPTRTVTPGAHARFGAQAQAAPMRTVTATSGGERGRPCRLPQDART